MLDVTSAKPHSTGSAVDDCWNRIGVRGDGSCHQLKQHAHCRNCPTYSAAALRLLDRDLPAECVADSTGHFAQAKRLEEQDTHSVVVFRLASEWFALPTLVLDEVSEQRMIHSLPHRRNAAVLGLVNVRGELLICASLVKMLEDNKAADLPANLYAPHYTDFNVKVLNKDKSLNARGSFNKGEMQQHFEKIFRELTALHKRVLKEGKPIEAK